MVQGSTSASALTHRAVAPAASADAGRPVLSERWPTLAAAMGRYQQNLAEDFSRQAYQRVQNGLITGTDRHELARQALELGLRPFDAQLLIACAIRQWSLDQEKKSLRGYRPGRPAASRAMRGSSWPRYALIVAIAAALDGAIVWAWLR